MDFKLLNLRNSRKFILEPSTGKFHGTDRRSFIKTLGMGVFAVNPLVETIKSVNLNPFEVRLFKQNLTISRSNKVVWEISDVFFEKGYDIKLTTTGESYSIIANNLKVRSTDLTFSMAVNILKESNLWLLKLEIPELSISEKIDFLLWLDKGTIINSEHRFDFTLLELNDSDKIELKGNGKIELSSDWNIAITGKDLVTVYWNGDAYKNDSLTIQPFEKRALNFLKSVYTNSVAVTISNFKGWDERLSKISFYSNHKISFNQDTPDLNFILHKTESGNFSGVIWVVQHPGTMHYWPDSRMDEKFILDKYFFYSEYIDHNLPVFYLSAQLPSEGEWLSTSLGGFKFQNDNSIPVFESHGVENEFTGHIFEPRLIAYQPIVNNATSIPSYFTHSFSIEINPERRLSGNGYGNLDLTASITQHTGINSDMGYPELQSKRKVAPQIQISPSKVAHLNITFDEIRFVPKKAIKINVLRPEDLLFLQFEFHNFRFSNKGQAPFLELDDPSIKGTVIVFFPSQHTLEQAFFESNELPVSKSSLKMPKITTGNAEPALPVMQIRARKSRLVYELEAGHTGFPLMMEDLLDWSKYNLRVHPRAWIKLISIIKPITYQIPGRDTPVKINLKQKYLERDTKLLNYSIRLNQKNKTKSLNELIYADESIGKLLPEDKAITSFSEFNVLDIRNVNMTVGPIPGSSTSIEAPALMYISPNQMNDFGHKIKLDIRNIEEQRVETTEVNVNLRVLDSLGAGKGEISELWHTRLGIKLKNGKTDLSGLDSLKTIRVLWADEALLKYNADPPKRDTPFLASLDGNNRHKLVHQTSDYAIPGFSPIPVPVKNLMLSSQGAYLNWHAFFNIQAPLDGYMNISEWEHQATLGRDHYVKIVEKGYLFPFGHRAALVKVTERKFHQQTRSAVNRQRMYIVVLQKEVLYSRNDPDGKFIEFPFQDVRIETSATPNIDKPANILTTTNAYNFFIKVGGDGFKFDLISTDLDGGEHRFRMPMVFVENIIARDYSIMEQVINQYNNKADFTLINFWNQKIAYAGCMVDGDTTFETETINFGAQPYPAKWEGDIKFHPKIQLANVYIKQIEELTGSHTTASISLEDDNNAGSVFARVTGAVVDFSGGTDKSGGFISPNMSINALSKLQGPVGGDLADIKNLTFKAEKFFKALDGLQPPKIFGVIDLFSLLSDLNLGGSFNSMKDKIDSVRKEIDDAKNEILFLENQAKESAEDMTAQIAAAKKTISVKVKELLDTINSSIPKIPNLKSYFTQQAAYIEYKWQPEFKGKQIEVISGILNVNVDNPLNALTILTKLEKPFDSGQPTKLNTTARFENFGIDIVPLLEVNFNYLEFRSGSTQKTDVKVDINASKPIVFKGALSFVNSLQSIIPNTGFSEDGPYIDLQPGGVTAGFNISVPSVSVGICSICNISLGASITLPFTGAPLTMGFNFCTRENPFLLTISCFGGGGYFMMITTLYGIQSVEAAFEFGAAISLDVGVASGGVSVMGGFYFKVEKVHKTISNIDHELTEVTLTGYLRINGHLSILGMITVSLEFYLAFSAVFLGDKVEKLVGEATLKVKVEVLFFSKTVSVSVRRELKGADADPKFGEMIEEDDWQLYCLAFAS